MARAAVRPAAPVRLGRGSEPLCLISTERRPSSRRRQAPALGLMYNPNDDPDVISGLCDDAKKEMATTPGPSQEDARRRTGWGYTWSRTCYSEPRGIYAHQRVPNASKIRPGPGIPPGYIVPIAKRSPPLQHRASFHDFRRDPPALRNLATRSSIFRLAEKARVSS